MLTLQHNLFLSLQILDFAFDQLGANRSRVQQQIYNFYYLLFSDLICNMLYLPFVHNCLLQFQVTRTLNQHSHHWHKNWIESNNSNLFQPFLRFGIFCFKLSNLLCSHHFYWNLWILDNLDCIVLLYFNNIISFLYVILMIYYEVNGYI